MMSAVPPLSGPLAGDTAERYAGARYVNGDEVAPNCWPLGASRSSSVVLRRSDVERSCRWAAPWTSPPLRRPLSAKRQRAASEAFAAASAAAMSAGASRARSAPLTEALTCVPLHVMSTGTHPLVPGGGPDATTSPRHATVRPSEGWRRTARPLSSPRSSSTPTRGNLSISHCVYSVSARHLYVWLRASCSSFSGSSSAGYGDSSTYSSSVAIGANDQQTPPARLCSGALFGRARETSKVTSNAATGGAASAGSMMAAPQEFL